jgi:hypothetical protein
MYLPEKLQPAWMSNMSAGDEDHHRAPPPIPQSNKPQLDRSFPIPDRSHQRMAHDEPPPIPPGSTKPSGFGPPQKPLPPLPDSPTDAPSTLLFASSLPPKPVVSVKPPGPKRSLQDSHAPYNLKPSPPLTSTKPSIGLKPGLKPVVPSNKPAVHSKPQLKPPVQSKPGRAKGHRQSQSDLLAPLVPMKDKVANKGIDVMKRLSQPVSRQSENLQERFDAFSSSVSALLDKTDDIEDSQIVVSCKEIQSKMMGYRSLTRRVGGSPSEAEMAQICSAIEGVMSLVSDMFR